VAARNAPRGPRGAPGCKGEMGVRLCFHGTLVQGERLGLEARMEVARQTGYGAIDFDYREVQQALRARPGLDAAGFWAASGLLPGMAGGLGLPDPFASEEDFARGLAAVAEGAGAVAEAGGRQVGLVLANRSHLPEAEARPLVRERLRRLGAALEPYGLALAVEFIGVRHLWLDRPYPFCQSYAAFLELLESTGQDNVGLLIDSYHCHGAEVRPEEIAATPRRRLVYAHVNDAKPGPAAAIQDADRLIPGEGAIDLVGWFRALAQAGFDGCVAPEVLGPRLRGMTTLEAARACRDGALEAMRRAGVAVA
jgi:sugar phosphate isomerase/epimerase